jgi:uncharacterized membrane protein
MTEFEQQARAALDAKNDTQRQLAAAATCPPWRHALFGLLMGALIATPAFTMGVRYAIFALILVAIALIARADRKRMGMFVNGYRRGKTRIVAVGMLVVELGLYAVAVHRAIALDDHVAPFYLAALGVVLGWIGSIIWQRVFVSELAA